MIFSEQDAGSKSVVEARVAGEDHIWISIRSAHHQQCCHIAPSNHRKATHFYAFDDADKPGETFLGIDLILISDEQAADIVDFVDRWKNKVGLICVNCEAGISRSSGVALALSEIINGHDSGIRSRPIYHPNQYVKDLIVKHGQRLATPHTPSWFKEAWNNESNSQDGQLVRE